jgi:TatD DNase family protein
MNKIIDTHSHLDSDQFDKDRDDVINRCNENGIKFIIDPAVNFQTCKKVLELADRYESLYVCLGVHPHDAKEYNDTVMTDIEKLLDHKKVVGIGEIGLDYHYNFSPKDTQKEVFREFLKLAKRRSLPVIIHDREADKDIIDILESEMDENLKGQFHCFAGDKDMAKRVLDYGFYISFTGSITFHKNKYSDLLFDMPLEKMLLETDSPYMSPVPFRGKRNDPCNLIYIIKKIAEVKGRPETDIIEITYKNAINLFKLPCTI